MIETAILCVDDDQIVLTSLRDQISRSFGDLCICEIASSVKEAWEVIEELCEDKILILLIISDWLMPEMRGDQFLIEIHQRFPSIITVMLTGQADKEAIARTYQEANLYTCLSKPWTEEELVNIIKVCVERFNTL